MNLLTLEEVTKTVATKTLIDQSSMSIATGDRVALVAKNGAGKTTLLKIIAEGMAIDSGKITMKRDIRIGYLSQDPQLNPEHLIVEEILSTKSPTLDAVREYEAALKAPENSTKLQDALDAMNKFEAWEYEDRLHEIITMLKLNLPDNKIKQLSGGQQKRVALAKLLLDEFDLVVMDEPTNHLDLEMIEWLETFLATKVKTLLLVTHDRYFLDRVCNQILELENGKFYKHQGDYDYYLEQQHLRHINHNRQVDQTKLFLKKELEWVRRQPQGRQTKASARVNAFYDLSSSVGSKHVVDEIKLEVQGRRVGSKILELHNISKSFGEQIILDKFNYKFRRGEKVGIIGANGVGKTTFLKLILGEEKFDSGNVVWGETIKFGYYSQQSTELNDNQRVIEAITDIASNIKLSDGTEISAGKLLERFLFSPIEQQNLIAKLSGGERKRLSLLRILISNPNFLILDEPTNDFDLMTLEVLADFLQHFAGCLIVISHDRYFMDQIVDHLFVFEGNGVISDFPGNYSDYRSSHKGNLVETETSTNTNTTSSSNVNNENELFRVISKLEKRIKQINDRMLQLDFNDPELVKLDKELKQSTTELTEKTELWLTSTVK